MSECCSMLQRVAACCSMLQCCILLQSVAFCCSLLQCCSVVLCFRVGEADEPYGVATISRVLNIIGLFCKRAL